MEAAPVSFRRIHLSGYPSFSGDGISRRQAVAVSAVKRCLSGRSRICGVGVKFSDEGHEAYYRSPKCGAVLEKKMKEKGKKKGCNGEAKELKKKLKVVKGLSKKLSDFSGMGLSLDQGDTNLSGEAKVLAEAAEGLLGRLQQLRAAEKEAKRRRKEEKAVACMKKRSSMVDDCESSASSSSSESSDSECEQVIGMSCSRKTSFLEPQIPAEAGEKEFSISRVDQAVLDKVMSTPILVVNEAGSLGCLGNKSSLAELAVKEEEQDNNLRTRGSGGVAESSGGGGCCQRIEVCMGGKCRKSGAAELLQEFQRMVGVEEAVVGCKCMGKCKAGGPNVRLRDPVQGRPPSLCIGVGLEDVASLVSNFFVEDPDHLASPPPLLLA